MEVTQVPHMNGGMGETSYANNLLLQVYPLYVISMTKPMREATITALFSTAGTTFPVSLAVVDLRCSCGPNTLYAVYDFIDFVIDLCNVMNHKLPEFQVFLNDLPDNDFKLPEFQSLHFIHSSYNLQWLSQVPRGLEENKGNISMARLSPPKGCLDVLGGRMEELVLGSRMVLTPAGRRIDEPPSEDCCNFWDLLAIDLNKMVTKVTK
ncbi:hypothetical protein EUGRSUZ_H03333 [Eucalyptus grandis]|uniref:Uncharacterized protein n=2 Tax=Eucalyptus grandis TaxID=71139 RepID=A0ACC3JYQ0_EUCGR|nr:hypothetical protein EUGRSUZ_H03333 [Eucalyptus grandis]